jgi:hypothetical protein
MNSILWKAKTEGRNLNSEKSQDYALKPQRNCTLMNSALRTAETVPSLLSSPLPSPPLRHDLLTPHPSPLPVSLASSTLLFL